MTTNTYAPNNLVATQTTVDGQGTQVEVHSYGYDSHHNLVTKTSTTAKPSSCGTVCLAGPTTYGTYTTTYGYDAYDRLVHSSVYSGAKATGLSLTDNSYVLDVSGNVTQTTRLLRTGGTKPTTTRQVLTDQLDDSGQLTQRTTGSTVAAQQYDDDGRVTTALSGAVTTYRADGLPATVTQGGATTTFGYWADGTRRRSSTVTAGKAATSTEFHYGPDGTLVNDTTTSGAGASASASYLVTAGREARTLLPGTTPAGAVKTAATTAPVTSGAGVGYFLRDRHSSVTALVDSTGAVTNTYAYGDYGAPALLSGRPGSVVGTTPGTTPGTVNPLQYSGASLKAMYTDAALGTMMTPARFYDPSQGRFTARDAANLHNRYVGFDANPIMKADPTGQSAVGDFFLDALYVIVFAVAVYVTGGAAAAAAPAIFGAEAATAATAAAVTTFTAQAVATTANLVGLAANATRFADDVDNATSGAHFLTDSVRSDLNSVATVAGSVAGVAGMFAAGAETATAAAEDATGAAAKAAPDVEPVDESGYEADDESGYGADDESDEEAGDQKLSTSSRPRSSSAPDRLNRSSLASDDGAQQLGDRKIGSVLRDSPGQDATVKDAVSSQQLNDGLPDGYRRAPTGKDSVLRRAWDDFTGKSARVRAQAQAWDDEQARMDAQELKIYLRSDRFATDNTLAPDDFFTLDISNGVGG